MSTLLMTGAPAVAPTALTQDGHLGLGEAIVFGVVAWSPWPAASAS